MNIRTSKPYRAFGSPAIGPAAAVICGLWLALSLPILAQVEPCGLYEEDGQPGYGAPDLWYTAQFWTQHGDYPDIPDFNGDQVVNVRDLIRQSNCMDGLNHGLLGRYYGFEDGSDSQEIGFPDFDNLPGNPDPAVVRATEEFEVLDGYRGFMDSDMRHQYGGVYEGYLFVPETANYTLHIFAQRGMRVTLDGNEILFVDIWPQEDSVILPLSYGLHPIRIDFYVASGYGRILLDWSSNGTVIGATSQTVDTRYLYHVSTAIPQHALTELEILVDPPSGTRTVSASTQMTLYALGPDSEVSLQKDGQEIVLRDGRISLNQSLQPGLNKFALVANDGQGRTQSRDYYIYRDNENLPNSGLAALLYAADDAQILPKTDNLEPFHVTVNPGTQMDYNTGSDSVTVGDRVLWGGNLVRLQGTIQITNPGNYRFYVGQGHKLRINGEFVSGIWADYPGQWDTYNEIYLETGRHHYMIDTYSYWGGPDLDVYWAFEGGSDSLIPNSVFRHGPAHTVNPTRIQSKATGGRVSDQLMLEYLFQPGNAFADTSGQGHDLIPDPRAIQRPTGGITYQAAGALTSEQGGVHTVSQIVENGAFSLEADFIYERDVTFDWTSRLLASLSSDRGHYFATLEVYNNDIRFWVYGSDGNYQMAEAENALVKDTRFHLVGTYNGSVMRLFLNGVLVDSVNFNVDFDSWHNLVVANVGQRNSRFEWQPSIYDQQMYGTFLAVAFYAKALGQAEVHTNRDQNLILSPTPGPLPAPPVTAFPPPGTTPSELAEAFHILNRLSFGPSPESVAEILAMGVDPWITAQMNPGSIDDSALESLLAADWFRPQDTRTALVAQTLFRMATSKRQLQEVVTQFWENHFNTQMTKVDHLAEELAENERFRSLAFGDFGDLLLASAMNYPMTVYLDNTSNVVGAPNENYGRELFELFSMGVNNGYTQADIVEGARCFTGWTVRNGKFFFDPGRHDYGEKTVLGLVIPAGGGLSDGIQLIEHVVGRSETADFISWKLCQVFIDDDPPADVVNAVSATFQATNGDITQVLQTLFAHARFRTDLAYRGNKVKTPLEFLTSIVRISESFPVTSTMVHYLEDMGMLLFDHAEPTGFAEEGVDWIDTNSLLNRWNLVNDLTCNRGNGRNGGMSFKRFIEKRGLTDATGLLDFFSDVTTFGTESPGVRPLAEAWMTDNDPGSFVLTDSVLDGRVRQTFSLYLRLPELNKQ